MAIRKLRTSSKSSLSVSKVRARKRIRSMLMESLESRRLMAVGPQLIGIQPNNSDLLLSGAVRTESPRELVFRFDDAQLIDADTLSGIRLTRTGGDGSFGLPTISTDFGSSGAVDIQLTSKGLALSVQVSRADLGANVSPAFSVVGSVVNITLNSNFSTPTTGRQLVDSINQSTTLRSVLTAKVNGGFDQTRVGSTSMSSVPTLQLTQTGDIVIKPGAALVGSSPNENEVTLRFAENLPDDSYRIEIFGYDDPTKGIVGLRNDGGANLGELFRPTTPGTRQDTIDFRLDLGPQVQGVVPQPVVRNSAGQLEQQRDTIVVYFNQDKLLVENDSAGNPTARSAENPKFYQLFYTSDTVRNTDDIVFTPSSVKYNASANTATLRFQDDINQLAGGGASSSSFRLRIGTSETAPFAPVRSEASATAIVDLNTAGAVKLRFTSREVGEGGSGIQLVFTNSLSGTPVATASGRTINVDLGRANLTAQELVDLLRNTSSSSSLVLVDIESGSGSTVVGNRVLSYSPVTLLGLGSSFNTATNLGVLGASLNSQSHLSISSAIDPFAFNLDLPGASDDPAHRTLVQNLVGSFEDHVNASFGADDTAGITTIYYNFKSVFSTDNLGTPLINAITPEQKLRVREALSLWASYIGVQFVESPDLGVTISTGALTGFRPLVGTQVQTEAARSFGVRIDPTFNNSLITLASDNVWKNNYGESYFRTVAAAIGMVLGLEHAGNLPETTLMRLDPNFLSAVDAQTDGNNSQLNASDETREPVVPGNQDILHGQYLHRNDGTDIDLYRFEVDLGTSGQVGLLTAETYSQRLTNSSALNTNLELFRQVQATASTNMGLGDSLSLAFTAVRPGTQGNQLQVFFTQSNRGNSSKPSILVFPNAISIDLNSTVGAESTVQDVIDVIRGSSAAGNLLTVSLQRGSANTRVGANTLTNNPVVLSGGRFELVSQNDDYFSEDSLLRQSLTSGVYFIGVSASGNSDYNAALPNTGFGGKSQGNYELRVSFRAAVDTNDAIQDLSGVNDPAVALDGDADGQPGGTFDFWFETRPLNRTLSFNAGASAGIEGRTVRVVGASGTIRDFEFSQDPLVNPGRIRVAYQTTTTAGELAANLATAINGQSALQVTAIANGAMLVVRGERQVIVDPLLTLIDVGGKTIFVDKLAGPNADGSLARPFNNIAGSGVANAFGSALPGDIVRIVGNGGVDGAIATSGDNFAYEIGAGLLAGTTLSDGLTMEVPQGVTAMIDAGAIFKMRRSQIGVGSTNLNINRSGAALQVLGAPILLDAAGNALRQANGQAVPGSVFFTSWLDESIGFDTYSPSTSPTPGDWGGISFRRDVDSSAGRKDLEDEGIFLQYASHADIRYGGGIVIVDSVQQSINPIQMLETRPTITDNRITFAANAAMSALPNSFEETNFNEPRFQLSGRFTSDYDRVGPLIRRNTLTNNSINGLFISVATGATGTTQAMTVPGRFDDIDIVHVITENVVIAGAAGGAVLDNTVPPSNLISTAAALGGVLLPGDYNYKLTFVDRNGYESIPSDASVTQNLQANQTAISVAGLPSVTSDFVARRLYRSGPNGIGPYELVAVLDKATSTYLDIGAQLGGTLSRDRLNVSGVTLTRLAGGTLPAGTFNYRIVLADSGGREGLASAVTVNNSAAGGSIRLSQIPLTQPGFVSRRIYRSSVGGVGPYVLVGELLDNVNSNATTFVDTGVAGTTTLSVESFGVKRPRLSASLVVDPGSVIKLESARIEATFGAHIIAEGTDSLPISFTSRLDDTVGAGGTFDTNNNLSGSLPSPRDWGGIYMAATSTLSLDHARFAYAGGVTKLDSTFRAFNTIEIHQAKARIANTLFENNADGFGGQGPGTRNGRLSNEQATIFVRGSQPVLIGNEFRNNLGSAITIDSNSMIDDLQSDPGRQTGSADRNPNFLANRGPLVRENRFLNNDLNGLKIRAGEFMTAASVWDDSDIVHVLFDEIFVGNVEHEGGLRLQSAPNESLVVKFSGYGSNFNRNLGAGLTANGQLTSATERVGGTLHVLGQPGFPVILTSLRDDTVGAGLRPDGSPQNDTNNDGIGSVPQEADWRGILLDQYSNDRNVAIALETEDFTAAAPGPNGSPSTAQVLGDLAGNTSESNENLRLGFVVEGVLSQSEDVDVYSFSGKSGTEVWFDVDYTAHNSDLVIEILDANGQLLARSDNSAAETVDPSLLLKTNLVDPNSVNPLAVRTSGVRTTSGGLVKEDGSTNPLDPGLRLRLPGSPGTRSNFYFRIRSASTNSDAFQAGLSSGSYQVQVRLREAQEWAGSSVNYADIRYAMNGVHLRGIPGESPLIGEAAEDENVGTGAAFANNGTANGNGRGPGFFSFFGNPGFADPQTGNRPQYLGNILKTAKGAISVAGNLSASDDLDFYMIEIRQEDLVDPSGFANSFASVVFDLDYADGLNRPDISMNIFQQEVSSNPFEDFQYRLIYTSDSSNIAEDQARPLAVTDVDDLSRGSAGTRDAYIGPVALQEGTYLVGISSAAFQPRTRVLSPFAVSPVNSVRRIVDEDFVPGVTTADPPVVQNFLPRTNVGPTGQLVSKSFDLGEYSAADLPAVYIDYTFQGGTFDIFINDPTSGNPATLVATSAINPNVLDLSLGTNSLKIPLVDLINNYNFSGRDNLSITFASNNPNTTINNVIIGFAERGELNGVGNEPSLLLFANLGINQLRQTRVFSLETYIAGIDNPALSFNYEVLSGNLDVIVIDQFGFRTTVASTDIPNAPQPRANAITLTRGAPLVGLLSMNRWADEPGLRVEFRTRADDPTNVQISNVKIVLSDGSRVGSNEPNSTYTPVNVPSTTVTTGAYQLEVRLGEQFFTSASFGAPTLTKSFDTNDRLAEQITIVAPAGANLTDGDRFAISDGGSSITFEFTVDGTVGLGAVPILFSATDPDYVVARALRAAINSPSVQSRLRVRAATTGGEVTGTSVRAAQLNLFGSAAVSSLSVGNPAGQVQVIVHEGGSDRNARRDQAQVLIQNSFIRSSRDYGVWSEPAGRLLDPRDFVLQTQTANGIIFATSTPVQSRPALSGTQAVRNLPQLNNGVQGGLLPGLVIQNNVLEEGGLGGINIQGESPIWMISPFTGLTPATDNNPTVNANGTHFGFFLDDGDILSIDADRTRVRFEFEDLAGASTAGPVFGSGQVEGNGYAQNSTPVYYREDGGSFYQRLTGAPFVAFGTSAVETMRALRDSILGSIFVTNGTTQTLTATVAESLLGADPGAPDTTALVLVNNVPTFFGYPEYFNRPAVYLEGATNVQFLNSIGGSSPFDIRTLDLGEAPQPQARIVNNTIIGSDGRASFNGEQPTSEPNDQIQSAEQTWQGTAHNPLNYVGNGVIGDSGTGLPGQDIDFFQFKLGLGERALIDVDTTSTLDSVVQIFDSKGVVQPFGSFANPRFLSDDDAAPGETVGKDPYIDFTATAPGVYYAAISSKGNSTFDPLSFANRQAGATAGRYTISIGVRQLQDFVITAEDGNAYQNGDTFTIFGVPDIAGGSAGRTFEFIVGTGTNVTTPGNIPINILATWRYPDVARAIAKAINEGGTGGGPVITNAQSLPNGTFGNASPLPPVLAKPLGGLAGVIDADLDTVVGDRFLFLERMNYIDELGINALSARELERIISGPFREVNPGLQLHMRRTDGFIVSTSVTVNGIAYPPQVTSLSHLGLGHDRESTTPISPTSWGDGTTEHFVVVRNAAFIQSNGSIIVDPDANDTNNLDQLLPETGVLASRGASPTILNNVFFNLQSPVINEESRRFPLTLVPSPYGTNNPNFVLKPGDVVVGGSIYQYYESAVSSVRFGTGIETVPTNVPNTSLDLNIDVPNGVQLFVNAQAGIYLPASNSPLIDSSVDSLLERPLLADVKQAVGLVTSPLLAPTYDLVGQLRTDDPSVAPPSGLGQNVFKDRGALDRADFIGPAAILLTPIDNDALGIDQDGSDSVVQLESGVYPEFRVQLADGNEPANPLLGLGVNDNTVSNSIISGLRLTGAAVVLFENGRMLTEGIDYSFAYNATRDEIILTPLAGVWKNDRVYEISINNRDRFVMTAPAGDQISDGDQFTILDSNGGAVYFEFESGYRLQVPQGLVIQIPLAGGGFGGVTESDLVTINDGSRSVTFEFDTNLNSLAGNVRIPILPDATRGEIAAALIAAIQASSLAVFPQIQTDGNILLGAEAGVTVNTTFSRLTQPSVTQAFKVPDLGRRPGGIVDGQSFILNDGRRAVTYEFDDDGTVAVGNFRVDISGTNSAAEVTDALVLALSNGPISLSPISLGNGLIYLGLGPNATASAGNSALTLLGVARTLADGQTFTISEGATTKRFEFNSLGGVAAGNIEIQFTSSDSQDVIGNRVATAIAAAGLSLTPTYVGNGNIAVGGTANHAINTSGTPSLSLTGTPGVQTRTQLQVFGDLIMNIPSGGGNSFTEGQTFSLTNNGVTINFEFDTNTLPSQPGNVLVPFTSQDTAQQVAGSIALAIRSTALGLNPTVLANARISLGVLASNQVALLTSPLSLTRDVISDGEAFTISNGTRTVTFEFENIESGSGFASGRTPILFSSTSTVDTVTQTMKAAIESAGLGLTTTLLGNGTIQLNDTPQFSIDTSLAPKLRRTGVPNGATPIAFVQDASFTSSDLKLSIIDAINAAAGTNLMASNRGGATLFVENAVSIRSDLDSYFIRGVADVAGNLLKPNRINNETQFTILMPGVELDYGDAPDPLGVTGGRYATKHENDGARHVLGSATPILLGSGITADLNGTPTADGLGDSGDDGVSFDSDTLPTRGKFNRNIFTNVTITLSSPGYTDAWIDFNADGDWDDPGEQILDSARFTSSTLTRTFQVTVPATAPIPAGPTTTFARFRTSSAGGLVPTGLAVDGEVEDYAVIIVPGTPPTAVNDTYNFNEDSIFSTSDPSGAGTPGFTVDDGLAANDQDPEGGVLGVQVVSFPAHSQTFNLNSDGTFTYRPVADFNGTDTFTYRVNDGVLSSNNFGTVTINVVAVNDAPIGGVDLQTTDEDIALNVSDSTLLSNDAAGPSNESSQTIRITGVSPISDRGGSVSLASGRVIYTPPSNYSGPDRFTYTITDNGTTNGLAAPLSSVVVVNVTVLDKNDTPITTPKSGETNEDVALDFTTAQLIAGDVAGPPSEAGQSLVFSGVVPTSTNGGTVTLVGNTVRYTPRPDFHGNDTFFYEVSDNGTSGGNPDPMIGRGTVTVRVNPINDTPRVQSPLGTVTMLEDEPARVIDLNTVFFDPDVSSNSDTLSFTVNAGHDVALVNPTIVGGLLNLQLLADRNGSTTISITARDSSGQSVTSVFNLVVTPVNDSPRLVQALSVPATNEDVKPANLVLAPEYFFDPDTANGDVLTYTITSNSNPLLVTPTVTGGALAFTLGANRSGNSVIVVQATDSTGQTAVGTLTLTVRSVNDAPVTVADSYTVPRGTTLTTTDPRGVNANPNDNGVLANDSDPEGNSFVARLNLVDLPKHGTVTLNLDGTFTYVHNGLSQTTDTFSYRADDSGTENNLSAVTTVTLTIGQAPPPLHQNPLVVGSEDGVTGHRDVNADGFISPIDALIVINFLNSQGSRSVVGLQAPPPYRDVNGDNFISPVDALLVINYLNSRRSGGGGSGEGELQGEGESMAAQWMAPIVAGRGLENSSIGVRTRELADGELYGPVQQFETGDDFFAEVGSDSWFPADTSWVDLRKDADEGQEMPVDLAFASLMPDLDENGAT